MINRKFIRVQKWLQNSLPYIGLVVISLSYIGTAVLMGYFLSLRLDSIYLASLVSFSVSLGRMFVVFQSQMGVEQVKKRFDIGAIAAALMTIYTAVEAYVIAYDFFVSLVGLILIGFVAEVIYLDRLNAATKFSFFTSPEKVSEYKDYLLAEKKIDSMLIDIENEDLGLGLVKKHQAPTLSDLSSLMKNGANATLKL